MSKMNRRNHAIGVFDSGIGGLTVVKELIKKMPNENIVYFGDTARVPYGTKSRESIIRFSKQNVAELIKHKVKLVVVACNSSSSVALPVLKKAFKIPIIGVIDPGARNAVMSTKSKTIGVIATQATISSCSYNKRIKDYGRSVKVISQSCPLFVPLAEEGLFNNGITHKIASQYLSKIKKSKADILILGCTHYPLLKSVLRNVVGKKVKLVDSAESVAKEVRDVLKDNGISRTSKSKARYKFLVSDEPKHFKNLAVRFLGRKIRNVQRCMYV